MTDRAATKNDPRIPFRRSVFGKKTKSNHGKRSLEFDHHWTFHKINETLKLSSIVNDHPISHDFDRTDPIKTIARKLGLPLQTGFAVASTFAEARRRIVSA